MKVSKKQLLIIWVIPTVLFYIMSIFSTLFILTNLEGLKELSLFAPFTSIAIVTFLVALLYTYKIQTWRKKGEL